MRIFQCLNIIQNLRRPGRADQHAGHNTVLQNPCQCHFRQGLSPFSRQPIQLPDLSQPLLCQRIFLQEAAIRADSAVLGNSVKISICQHALSQGTEGYNSDVYKRQARDRMAASEPEEASENPEDKSDENKLE